VARRGAALAALSSVLVAIASPALSADISDARSNLEAMAADLSSRKITELRIYHMSYDVLTRRRVTPEDLPLLAQERYTIVLPSPVADRLREAIRATHLRQKQEEADVRWGLELYGVGANPVHSIFIGRPYARLSGRHGYVDSIPIAFDDALASWFERNFPD
jgi:hypothetical protein